MAVLSVDTLSGCSSIPSFLGGTSDTPANPSITVFHNTSAPTNWTKNTSSSIDNISLRVIGGAEGVGISTGGSVPFSTVFSPKTSPLSSSTNPSAVSLASTTAVPATTQDGGGSITVQDHTLSNPDTPPHTHPYTLAPNTATNLTTGPSQRTNPTPGTTGLGGGSETHSHPGMSAPHTHPITDTGHSHPVNSDGPHAHTFTLNQDFDILYVDVIIATKD